MHDDLPVPFPLHPPHPPPGDPPPPRTPPPKSNPHEIIPLAPPPFDLVRHFAPLRPRDPILHIPGDQKSGIGDLVGADADVAVLDEAGGGLDGGGHVQAGHDDGQATAAEARRGEGADGAEGGGRGREEADGVQGGDDRAGQR